MKILRNGFGYVQLSDLETLNVLHYDLPDIFSSSEETNHNDFVRITDKQFLHDLSLMDFIVDFDYLRSLSLSELLLLYHSSCSVLYAYNTILEKREDSVEDDDDPIRIRLIKQANKAKDIDIFIAFDTKNTYINLPEDIDDKYYDRQPVNTAYQNKKTNHLS